MEGEAKHYCPNESGCPPQIKGKIEHFISRKAMDIGIGEAIVAQLFDAGLLNNVADLYDLNGDSFNRIRADARSSWRRWLPWLPERRAVR